MQLSLHADYACRVLMYLASKQARKSSIPEIAASYNISENHLVKVVHRLGKEGFIETTRGRGGGIRLARDPKAISIGEVVRVMEPHFSIVECFDAATSQCPITRLCRLKNALAKATDSFLSTLDSYTLADLTVNQQALARALEIQDDIP